MNQSQSYQTLTFKNSIHYSEISQEVLSTSNLSTVVFDSWGNFEQWLLDLQTNHSSFFNQIPVELSNQLISYKKLQPEEEKLKSLTSLLATEEQLSLESFREIWMVSQSILTMIWSYSHQWVQTVSHEVQSFLKLWQTQSELISSTFKTLGVLPSCTLNESDWECFREQQHELCKRVEPYLMCLNEGVVGRYERACRWIDGTETLEEVNQQVLDGEWGSTQDSFSRFEGKSLNSVQSQAISSNETILAITGGAGTGKTTTLIAKINYLIREKGVSPERILVLGNTQEQLTSLRRKLGSLSQQLVFQTYHKLALELLTKELGYVPTLAEDGLLNHSINQILMNWFSQKESSEKLIYFFSKELGVSRSNYRVSTLKEFYELTNFKDLQQLEISSWEDIENLANTLGERHLTLKHEWVKSNEEVLLANFLFLNGIEYQYEIPYRYNTLNEQYRQYYPDFYLPQYDLYLEHFGLNEQGKAVWLPFSKSLKYEESVAWKRDIHKQHQTTLVETYSYEFRQSNWMMAIRHRLEQHGVRFQRVELYDVLKHLANNQRPHYYRFQNHLKCFIELFYKQGKQLPDLEKMISEEANKQDETSSLIFYQLIKEIISLYENRLKELNLYDLNTLFSDAMKTSCFQQQDISYIFTDQLEECSSLQFEFVWNFAKTNQASWILSFDDNQSIHCLQDSCKESFHRNFQKMRQCEDSISIFRLQKNYRLTEGEEKILGNYLLTSPSLYPSKEMATNSLKQIQTYSYRFSWEKTLETILSQLATTVSSHEKVVLVSSNINTVLHFSKIKILKRYKKGIQLKHTDFPHLQLFHFTPKQLKGIETEHLILLETDELEKSYAKTNPPQAFNTLIPYTKKQLESELLSLYYLILTRSTKSTSLILHTTNKKNILQEFKSIQKNRSESHEKSELSFLNFIPQFNEQVIEFPICRPSIPQPKIKIC